MQFEVLRQFGFDWDNQGVKCRQLMMIGPNLKQSYWSATQSWVMGLEALGNLEKNSIYCVISGENLIMIEIKIIED